MRPNERERSEEYVNDFLATNVILFLGRYVRIHQKNYHGTTHDRNILHMDTPVISYKIKFANNQGKVKSNLKSYDNFIEKLD